jgi:hypothetical protein
VNVHVLRAPGVRVVASPEALDAAEWQDAGPGPDEFEPLILRFAPDEAFAVGATGVHVDDPDAIVEAEVGYTAVMFPVDEFIDVVLPRIEWPVSPTRPAFCQGSIAGVPSKLYLDTTGAATVFIAGSYVDDFLSRLPVNT